MFEKKETRKCGNCECIATWGRPTLHQSFWAVFGQFCSAYAHTLLFSSFRSKSDVVIRFSDPNFIKESNNLAIRRCFHALDLRHLTLNVCSTSDVTWSDCVPNMTDIEQSAAELQRFKDLKFEGGPPSFIHGRWISYLARPLRAHRAPTYKIWANSNNPRRIYSDLKVKNLGSIRNYRFWKLIFEISQPSRTDDTPMCQFSTQFGNARLNYWWFRKFLSAWRDAVTSTCDPVTSNGCRRPGVTWSNSVPNISHIEPAVAQLLKI